jgi:hypothetical protein
LYQQQQPATSTENDRRRSSKQRHDRGVSGWHEAALQLSKPVFD